MLTIFRYWPSGPNALLSALLINVLRGTRPLFGHFALPNSIQLLFLNYGDFLSTYKLLELVLG